MLSAADCPTPTEAARIISEICERLDELEAIRPALGRTLLSHLSAIGGRSPYAFTLAVRLLHGRSDMLEPSRRIDESRIDRARSDRAARIGTRATISRQCAHQRFTKAIRIIRSQSPLVAKCISQIMTSQRVIDNAYAFNPHAPTPV